MSDATSDGGAREASTIDLALTDADVDAAAAERPRGKPGRRPKGSVPTVVADLPDKPDPGHVLTWRQRKVLQVIRESVQRRGYPPSMREIGEAVGLTSTSSVSYQLSTLQAKGYLGATPGARARSRSGCPAIRPSGPSPIPTTTRRWTSRRRRRRTCRWSAGSRRVARSSPRRRSRTFSRCPGRSWVKGTLFLLKVVGDSMINAAIADGDWVVVRQQPVAENGDIVAAMLDGEATVKTFKRSADHIWLMPHNPAYTPIPGDEAEILGKVVAVLRRV